jgi:hypothetical protein
MPVAVFGTVVLFGGIFFTALGFILWRIDRRFEEPGEAGSGRKLMIFGLCWTGITAALFLLALLVR